MNKETKEALLDALKDERKIEKIILVKYTAFGTIEGFVENEKDFDKWLKKHNAEREIEERKEEFELEEIKSIWNLR